MSVNSLSSSPVLEKYCLELTLAHVIMLQLWTVESCPIQKMVLFSWHVPRSEVLQSTSVTRTTTWSGLRVPDYARPTHPGLAFHRPVNVS